METEKALTVSIPEAGRRLANLGEDASYRAAAKGDIPFFRIGGRKRVSIAAIEELLKSTMTKKAKDSPGELNGKAREYLIDITAESRLIDQIQAIRTKNNKCWMDIMRVAMQHAPKETKALLREIQKNDLAISELNGRLGQDE